MESAREAFAKEVFIYRFCRVPFPIFFIFDTYVSIKNIAHKNITLRLLVFYFKL